MRYVLLLSVALAGCVTLRNPNVTQEQADKDHYECERDAYDSHAQGLMRTGLYNDCMKARGYK